MSLLDEMTEEYVLLTKTVVDDGLGGYTVKYVDGVTITGAMAFDASTEAQIAQAQGVTSVYTFSTKKNIVLSYHDVMRRVKDGKIFRVTSDGDDKYTPPSAHLNMRGVTCEEWELPSED